MEITSAIDEYLASKQNSITRKTYVWYETFLGFFATWCQEHNLSDLSQITVSHVQQFVSAAATTNTNTRHHRAQIVKGFLNWCSKDDELGVREKTVRRIEMPRVEQPEIEIFSNQDIMRLFRACDKTQHPHRNRAILHVLLDTGIRAAELCYDGDRPEEETGLRLENLFLGRAGDSFIRVMGKGRKVRTVGLGQETALAIRRYLNRERGHAESPFVFLARKNEPLSVRMLQQLLHHISTLARVSDCHAHRFRHTFAINQLMNGTSSLVLMQLLGHSTLDSTKIYTRAMSSLQARQASSSVVDQMRRRQRYP